MSAPPTAAAVPSAFASHALCILVESLLAGRRVVILGDASSGLGARAVSLGAKLVHVYDPDGARAARAARAGTGRGITIRGLTDEAFDVRDGAFDLALIPDVGALDGPSSLLARVRRLVGDAGVLVAAAPNPDAPANRAPAGRVIDYYALYDLVALQFAQVRMVGLVPFGGVTLAELGGDGETPSVSVDTQLAGEAEAPSWYVAVAGTRAPEIEPYLIVQLPPDASEAPAAEAARPEEAGRIAEAPAPPDAGTREALGREITEARAALELVARERDGLHERFAREESRIREDAARARADRERVEGERDRAVAERDRAVAERDRAVAERDREQQEAERARALAANALAQLEELRETQEHTVVEAEENVREWQSRFGELRDEALRASAHATEMSVELSRIGDAHAAEIAQYETRMRERAQAVKALELELVRRERIVHELVEAIDEARERGGDEGASGVWAREAERAREEAEQLRTALVLETRERATLLEAHRASTREAVELRQRLDALALEVATREADLQTTRWRVAELEQKLRMASDQGSGQGAPEPLPAATSPADADAGSPGRTGPTDGATAAETAAELEVLRKALAQEHEARVRAEGGEGLAAAREELNRQAVLIEQLSRELEARRPNEPSSEPLTVGTSRLP